MADPDPNSPSRVMTDAQWRDLAKGVIKAELSRQNLTYGDLAKRMSSIGVDENEASIRNKLSRGAFTFVFALQALEAIGLRFVVTRAAPQGYAIDIPGIEEVKLPAGAVAAILKAMGRDDA